MGAVLRRQLVAVSAGQWSTDAEGGASHQRRAIAFVDLTGYTALSLSLTPKELTRIVTEFEGFVAEAVSRHGGRLVKTIGDGAVFTADDSRRICRIASEIVLAAKGSSVLPPVRIGVTTGTVVNLGGDVFGPVVNLAARLVTVARDNSIVVDESTAAEAAAEFTFEELPPQQLKGIATATPAFRLV